MVQQQRDRHHLRHGLQLAEEGHRHALACPTFAIHSRSAEMAISRPMMISATIASTRLSYSSTISAADHHQLVGHRVEEGAERRHLVQRRAR